MQVDACSETTAEVLDLSKQRMPQIVGAVGQHRSDAMFRVMAVLRDGLWARGNCVLPIR